MVRVNLRRRIRRRVSTLQRCIRRLWHNIFICSQSGKACSCSRYWTLPYATVPSSPMESVASSGPIPALPCAEAASGIEMPTAAKLLGGDGGGEVDSDDLVALKISILGDHEIGKTSFLEKYAGDEKEEIKWSQMEGLNLVDRTFLVRGARISYGIWEVQAGGGEQIPMACKDSVAILFMFDLTSRCTLNNVLSWYRQARKWNQKAIPIIVGTKFDDFIQLPIDLQWTIASQARAYAKALNATLFFSSANYNINVNKIFKFITARLFDLPWTLERNLTIGEPIIDF